MLVSAEEVLDVRGSLLHVTETEAILLQLLRQLLLYQPKGLVFHFFFPPTCLLICKPPHKKKASLKLNDLNRFPTSRD